MNLPTKLTLLRIILIPVFIAVFFIRQIPYNYVISAGIFILAAFTDFLDGKIARKYNLVTDLGKFLDPIADKVLVASAFIVLLVSPDGEPILPWYASIGVAVILGRELIVTCFRSLAAAKGKVIAADMFGKVKTFIQDIAIFVLLCSGSFDYEILIVTGYVIFWASVLATLISGFECILKNKNVLSEEE